MDLTDILQNILHTYKRTHILSSATGTSSSINHILGHKAVPNKYRKIKITPCTLSNHKRINLDSNNSRNYRKYTDSWGRNSIPLNDNEFSPPLKKKEKKRNCFQIFISALKTVFVKLITSYKILKFSLLTIKLLTKSLAIGKDSLLSGD